MRFVRAVSAVGFGLVVLGSATAPALAEAVGGYTDVASTFQPGSTITVESPCFDLADADVQFVTLTAGDQSVSHNSVYGSPTLSLYIPTDVPTGTGLTLRGTCLDYSSQANPQFTVLESYGPVYIIVGQGIVDALPTDDQLGSFGVDSTWLTLIAGAMIAVGTSLLVMRRRVA